MTAATNKFGFGVVVPYRIERNEDTGIISGFSELEHVKTDEEWAQFESVTGIKRSSIRPIEDVAEDESDLMFEPTGICDYCENEVPVSKLRRQTVEVESGRRGGNVRWHGGVLSSAGARGFLKGMSYSPGFKYYKNVTVHICSDCLEAESAAIRARRRRTIRNWTVVVLVITGLYYWNHWRIINDPAYIKEMEWKSRPMVDPKTIPYNPLPIGELYKK